jgi:hypothetical protein
MEPQMVVGKKFAVRLVATAETQSDWLSSKPDHPTHAPP